MRLFFRSSPTAAGQKRKSLYYGWVIVAVLGMGAFVQAGALNPTTGTFIKPITTEFGWSRTMFAGALSAGTAVGGILALLIGPLLDRHGPRVIGTIGILVMGGAIASLSLVHQLWHLYVFMILARATLQGVVVLVVMVSASKWFVRQRGRAIALTQLGMHLGIALVPLYAQTFTSLLGWRDSLMAVGMLMWGMAVLPFIIFLRRQPEDLGLRPDGDDPEPEGTGARPAIVTQQAANREPEVSFTLKQVIRTKPFYLFTLATALLFGISPGMHLHMVAHLDDRGVNSDIAVLVITVWSFVSLGTSLIGGFIADRFPVRFTLGASYMGLALVVLLLINVNSVATAFLFAVLYGSIFGAVNIFVQIIFADYYGRASLGTIRGVTTLIQMLGNASGPLVAALAYDATGSYTLIFSVFVGLYVVGGIALFLAPTPQRVRAELEARAARG